MALQYKCVDIMKLTKDVITSQLTTGEKTALITCLADTGATHIAISTPMDIQSEFVAFGSTPSPRTISAETQEWCDLIHDAGMKVLHRGTFCGAEAIWGAGYIDGGLAIGTPANAASDGTATLVGRFYLYLNTNVGAAHMEDGDIFAPIPEGTTHAFDGHYWWPGGTQANYDAAYIALHDVLDLYAAANNKSLTFMVHNNFSECASGWLNPAHFADTGVVGADYYGQRQGASNVTVADYQEDWEQLYLGLDSNGGGNNNAGGYPQFWGEWGDLPDGLPSGTRDNNATWAAYLESFYAMIKEDLVNTGKMIGFNYWGGWADQNTSILDKSGSGASSVYTLNFRGEILKDFFTTVSWTNPSKPSTTWSRISKT